MAAHRVYKHFKRACNMNLELYPGERSWRYNEDWAEGGMVSGITDYDDAEAKKMESRQGVAHLGDTILKTFNEECKSVEIDAKFVSRLHAYQVGFVNKNTEHIEFFGGHLLGVQTVKFMPADYDKWFNDVLRIDDGPLEDALRKLDAIDPEHKIVASDTMNLTCAWLSWAIFNSKVLDEKQKHQAMIDVYLVLQYKFFTSRLYQHFRYPADKEVAEAAYTQLTSRYAIKKLGKWSAVFLNRSEDIIAKDSIHYKTITKMKVDDDVIYMLNDIQGRIRDMIKNIYNVFIQVHQQGKRIVSTSSIVEHDGQEILKDKTKALPQYIHYIKTVVADKNSFIREELVTVIERMMHTMPSRLFRETLEYFSDNYQQTGAKDIEEVIDTVLIHSFEHLDQHREEIRHATDLPSLLSTLRGVYMSSRSVDPILIDLREKTEKIATNATGSKNPSTIAAIRTGVLLYIILRSYTMRHYQ